MAENDPKVGNMLLVLVVHTLDSAIQQINHHPVDKYQENQLRYPPFEHLGPEL